MAPMHDIPDTPAKVRRPWGWYEDVYAAPGFKLKRIGVHPGQQISLQSHSQRAEHWVVVQGTARVTLGEQVFELQPGQYCDIALGQKHRLGNPGSGPLEIVEVQFGAYLGEDDITRFGDDYGRA
jgi:mannose-6-phosphate isomerase-like protein (cupin superfamily)